MHEDVIHLVLPGIWGTMCGLSTCRYVWQIHYDNSIPLRTSEDTLPLCTECEAWYGLHILKEAEL